MKNTMTFNDYTDTWFNKLVTFAKKKSNKDIVNTMLRATIKKPSHQNLKKLAEAISSISGNPVWKPLAKHIALVHHRNFRNEFRFHFSKKHSQSSATKELFSMIYQAIEFSR
jgi:hypothetical protein